MTPADFEKAYEENEVRLKGIIWFTVGLILLIIVTFVLMWFFLGTMKDFSRESQGPRSPVAMSEREKLPPEPRLQAAPGFGVDSPNGRVNLELRAPQSEYWELEKQWKEMAENGQKDPKTGAVIMLPVEEAKKKLLEESVKAKTGEEAEKLYEESRKFYSDASSGRVASETRR
jgi:hypothetical protein